MQTRILGVFSLTPALAAVTRAFGARYSKLDSFRCGIVLYDTTES
jgi:hypothetical protein